MFRKRLNELTEADLEKLISEEVPESAQVEYKATLPANKGQDPWIETQERIGDKARNEIIEEVIAFANAHGGTLLIGISETREKPARAESINPIPKCADLAERLRLQCRDCIEPQIPLLETHGVPVDDSGAGVVIVRVPASRMAPHRHSATLHCYTRRADRSEKMTMREIQDLTLNIERGLHALEGAFSERQVLFQQALNAFKDPKQRGFGLRVTALPLSPLQTNKVHGVGALLPPSESISYQIGEGQLGKLMLWRTDYGWKPILRGTIASEDYEDRSASREVHCNGLLEYQLKMQSQSDDEMHCLYPDWVLAMVANAILAAEKFRVNVGAPEVEYGLELAISAWGDDLKIMRYNGQSRLDVVRGATITEGDVVFPRYSIGPRTEFASLIQVIEQDFWHHVGLDDESDLSVDFDAAIQSLGLQK